MVVIFEKNYFLMTVYKNSVAEHRLQTTDKVIKFGSFPLDHQYLIAIFKAATRILQRGGSKMKNVMTCFGDVI